MKNKESSIYTGENKPPEVFAKWISREELEEKGSFQCTLMECALSDVSVELWWLRDEMDVVVTISNSGIQYIDAGFVCSEISSRIHDRPGGE